MTTHQAPSPPGGFKRPTSPAPRLGVGPEPESGGVAGGVIQSPPLPLGALPPRALPAPTFPPTARSIPVLDLHIFSMSSR